MAVDDQDGDAGVHLNGPLGAENYRDIHLHCGSCNHRPHAFEEHWIWWRQVLSRASVTGNEALRKADNAGALSRRLCNRFDCQFDRFLGRCGEWEIGKRDSNGAHSESKLAFRATPQLDHGHPELALRLTARAAS